MTPGRMLSSLGFLSGTKTCLTRGCAPPREAQLLAWGPASWAPRSPSLSLFCLQEAAPGRGTRGFQQRAPCGEEGQPAGGRSCACGPLCRQPCRGKGLGPGCGCKGVIEL